MVIEEAENKGSNKVSSEQGNDDDKNNNSDNQNNQKSKSGVLQVVFQNSNRKNEDHNNPAEGNMPFNPFEKPEENNNSNIEEKDVNEENKLVNGNKNPRVEKEKDVDNNESHIIKDNEGKKPEDNSE